MTVSPSSVAGNTTALGYKSGLDGLRAIAVTLVIASHLGIRGAEGGTIGVHIFFVLSGFLITSLLLQEAARYGNISLGTFYARRALRLLPAMLIVVIATDAYMAFDSGNPVRSDTIEATPSVLFYYANWWWFAHGDRAALGWFGHMWSLAVEEQFYLVWPLFLILVIRGRWSMRRLVEVLLLTCVVSLSLRTWAVANLAGGFFGTPMVAEMLMYGVIAALFLRAARPAVALWAARLQWLAVAYLGLYLTIVPTGLYNNTIGSGPALSGVAISTAVVILHVTTNQVALLPRILAWSPLVFLGRISFGMYLWHILICYSLSEWIDFTHHLRPLYWVTGYGLTVLVALISQRYVEAPVLRLKDSPRLRRAPGTPTR